VRTAAIVAASLIGLSGVGAFASGVYHRRPLAAADSGAHRLAATAPSEKRDNTLPGDTSAVGTYCPIPPRAGEGEGASKDKTAMTSTTSAGDSLLLSGQSVAPNTTKALCTGTAAPEKRP
jgi:hypothetical protein